VKPPSWWGNITNPNNCDNGHQYNQHFHQQVLDNLKQFFPLPFSYLNQFYSQTIFFKPQPLSNTISLFLSHA
jgi:hypothetical protein